VMKYLRPWLTAFAVGLATVTGAAAAEAQPANDVSDSTGATPAGATVLSRGQDSCGPTTPYRRGRGSRHRRRNRHHRRHHRHDRGDWRDLGRGAKIPGLS